MSKSENNPKNIMQKTVEMVKDPVKIITKPIEIIKMYTGDTTESKQRRSRLTDYAREHPVKTAALAGAIVACGAAVGTAALIAAPLLVASPIVAVGLVGTVAFGSSLAFRTASEKLHNLAKENREKPGPSREAGRSRADTKTLVKFRALNQQMLVDEHKTIEQKDTITTESKSELKIRQALANGGSKIIENLKKFNNWRKNTEENRNNNEQNSAKNLAKAEEVRKYYKNSSNKENGHSH